MFGGHGGGSYTFTNRSEDAMIITALNASPLTMDFRSTSQTPFTMKGYHATGSLLRITNEQTGYAGIRLSTGGDKDIYLDQSTHDLIMTSATASNIALQGSSIDRSNQRINFVTSSGLKRVTIGTSTGASTSGDLESDYTVDLYDDSGALIDTGLKIARSTRVASILAGKAAATRVNLSGMWQSFVTPTPNSGSSETDLFRYSVPTNMLNVNGSCLDAMAFGIYAANGNSKRLRCYFGSTTIFDSGAVAFNNKHWLVKISVMRISSTTQIANVTFTSDDTTNGPCTTTYSTPAENLASGTIAFYMTGTATSNSDITLTGGRIEWKSA
jgi:hypothetical protein